MNGQDQAGGGLDRLNYPGLLAGIALVILPFLGAWWTFSLGTDALVIALSPFEVLVTSFGKEITSPLITSLNIALKLVMIYYGVLLIAGSILRAQEERRSLSDILVRASARKFLWLVILFVVSVAIADFAINEAFSRMGVPAQVPYFFGKSAFALQVGPVAMTVPVIQGFTLMFGIAVLVALIALAASYYQDRGTTGARRVEEGNQAVSAGEKAPGETESQGR
ncbi:MAG: hypothetical protein LUO96_00210 [Methanomicrobiales archaeon]|nr:hypothetical protein [Methanomicrobiales archaeon]